MQSQGKQPWVGQRPSARKAVLHGGKLHGRTRFFASWLCCLFCRVLQRSKQDLSNHHCHLVVFALVGGALSIHPRRRDYQHYFNITDNQS